MIKFMNHNPPKNLTEQTSAERGLELIMSGKLKELRHRLGLSPSAMASLLYVSPITYGRWENPQPGQRMWNKTAERLDRMYNAALPQIELLESQGNDLTQLIPLRVAAGLMGVPMEVLTDRYRNHEMRAIDFGVLGLWVHRHPDITGEEEQCA